MLRGVESPLDALQVLQSTKPPLRVLHCPFWQKPILLFAGVWGFVNVLADLTDGLRKVYLVIWSGRTTWWGEIWGEGNRVWVVWMEIVWVKYDLGRFLLRGVVLVESVEGLCHETSLTGAYSQWEWQVLSHNPYLYPLSRQCRVDCWYRVGNFYGMLLNHKRTREVAT